jgi:hypothetical protein
LLDVLQKPAVDFCKLEDLLNGEPCEERVANVEDTLGIGDGQPPLDKVHVPSRGK